MLAVILATVTLSAVAQLALKVGMTSPSMVGAMKLGGSDLLVAAALSPWIWTGLLIYGLSVILWLWVLAKVELSVAYPFVGVSFLMTAAFGALLLNESVTAGRLAGTVLIVVGCILVARSA